MRLKTLFDRIPQWIKYKYDPEASGQRALSPSLGSASACLDKLSAFGLGGRKNNNNSVGTQRNNTHTRTRLRTLDSTPL